ncbi:hypothetical protein FRB94_009337 [Tulasnella sp. JGI-2019a]|nr:hypothetical protein FRB94_009337 [Tulasnella sp. JGI-2019a]
MGKVLETVSGDKMLRLFVAPISASNSFDIQRTGTCVFVALDSGSGNGAPGLYLYEDTVDDIGNGDSAIVSLMESSTKRVMHGAFPTTHKTPWNLTTLTQGFHFIASTAWSNNGGFRTVQHPSRRLLAHKSRPVCFRRCHVFQTDDNKVHPIEHAGHIGST